MNVRLCDVAGYRHIFYWVPYEKIEQIKKGSVHPKILNAVIAYDNEMESLANIKNRLIEIFKTRVRRRDIWFTQISCDTSVYMVNDIDYDWTVKESDEGIIIHKVGDTQDTWYYEEDGEYSSTIIRFASHMIESWKGIKGVELISREKYAAIADTIIEEVSQVGDDNDIVRNLLYEAERIIKNIHKRVDILLGLSEKFEEIRELTHEISRLFKECEDPLAKTFICSIDERLRKLFKDIEKEK